MFRVNDNSSKWIGNFAAFLSALSMSACFIASQEPNGPLPVFPAPPFPASVPSFLMPTSKSVISQNLPALKPSRKLMSVVSSWLAHSASR